jgi:Activator of Hsp90 ATPase homolog 1-like protein
MTTQAAHLSTQVEATLTSVWKGLTNTDVLGSAFFGGKVETTWKVVSPIHFRGDWKGKAFEDKGIVLTFSPEKQLRFTHYSCSQV